MSDGLLILLPPLVGWLIGTANELGHSLWVMLALTSAQSLALMFNRRFPLAVFVIVGGLELTLALLKIPVMAGFLVAASTLGGWGRGLRQVVGVASGLVALLIGVSVTVFYTSEPLTVVPVFAVLMVLFVGFWAGGRVSGRQRARIHELHARSRQLEAERERAEQRAAERERALLARELHDILNHSVTAMVLDAEAAADTGNDAEATLRRVAGIGRDSLAELRRLLGVIREAPASHDPLVPPPRLSDVEELVASLPPNAPQVHLERRGSMRTVDTSIELAAYRVVQESLTNVVKHVGAVDVDVVLSYSPSQLEIRITNPLPAEDSSASRVGNGTGVGLIGMRERVELLGGTLRLEPGPEQFSVHATLPLRSSS